jgi:hypothetical protein
VPDTVPSAVTAGTGSRHLHAPPTIGKAAGNAAVSVTGKAPAEQTEAGTTETATKAGTNAPTEPTPKIPLVDSPDVTTKTKPKKRKEVKAKAVSKKKGRVQTKPAPSAQPQTVDPDDDDFEPTQPEKLDKSVAGYESPTRAAYQAAGSKVQQKAGKKRQIAKAGSKDKLETGDVVDVVISEKLRYKGGDTVILGVVHEALPHRKYKVLTSAGVLEKKVTRNELLFQKDHVAGTRPIHPNLALPPEIAEKDAVALINPMAKVHIHCKCANVRI